MVFTIAIISDNKQLVDDLRDWSPECEHLLRLEWLSRSETLANNLQDKEYDIAILDEKIEGKNGWQILELIREKQINIDVINTSRETVAFRRQRDSD